MKQHGGMRQRTHLWFWLALSMSFCMPQPTAMACTTAKLNPALSAEKKIPAHVSRFEKAPLIDGNLDEEVWDRAAVLKDFIQTQPGDNLKATYPTEVRFGFDAKNLYIGIHAFDESNLVRATVAKRDDLSGNDYTAVWLDTFNDNRRAYVLLFNPLGIQADGIFTEGQSIDFSVDVVMQSNGRITADGYTVEVAVPFNSLRYEVGVGKLWSVHVLRTVRHLDEWDSWMPLRRESRDFSSATFTRFMEQAGHLAGIEKLGNERTLEMIPTLTLAETGRRVGRPLNSETAWIGAGRFVNEPIKPDFGLTAKLTLTTGVTLDAAVNPDFAQVEADQLVVTANQRFPLFFEEKRPFFLEGVEIFQTPIKALHTRTIIDPDIAVKLTGKRGRNTFGFMVASDNAPGSFSEDEQNDTDIRPSISRLIGKNASITVLRFKRDIGSESNIGVIATTYNFIERHNQLAGFDGRLTLNPQTVFTFQLLGTSSRRFFYDTDLDQNIYRTANGFAYHAQLQRNTRLLNVSLTARGYTPDYRADVGFIGQTNTNPWDLNISYNSEPKQNSRMISWSVTSSTRAQFNWQGRMHYAFEALRSQFQFKRQTYFKLDLYKDYQRVFEEEYGARRTATRQGAFIGGNERSTVYRGFTFEAGTAPSKKYSATLVVDRTWKTFDYDLGAGALFPRVSPAALLDSHALYDPGPGKTLDLGSSFNWRPTDTFSMAINFIRSRLLRDDTRRVAYDQRLYSMKATYQFTRFTFARVRMDYDTLKERIYGQFLFGWTPNPGTAIYAGYNDDLNRLVVNPLMGRYEAGLHRNRRTFFIKMSYLLRREL
jgi:hypothetical protein